MSDETRIEQLLEEVLDSGRTPEDVCAHFPELLWHVRERQHQCEAVKAQIDAIFPTPGAGMAARRRRLLSTDDALPQIADYQVDAVLGRGGVGVVYRAKHLQLNRNVALKMLLSGAFADPHELARFTREAQAVASLRHAHIVQVYDVGEFDGKPYFTMEIMDGGSLAQDLAGAPQPAARAASLLLTLATAAHVAHLGGIVHRDLKPSNILLTADGTPKISDFGLARRIAQDATMTEFGAHVGTPSYMAPEQAAGNAAAVGPPTDVYALGAILYETLTGRPPFRGESASDTERQVIAEEPVPPRRLNTRVPRDLDTVCLKCLSKDPSRRYPTAAALADDLGRFLRGEPVAARRAGPAERAWKWARRRPAVATAAAAALLLVVAALGGGMWIASDRAATARAVEGDLADGIRLQRAGAWPDANAALDRARIRLGDLDPGDLRRRLDQAMRDAELVARLDAIRLARAADTIRTIKARPADTDYLVTFGNAGLADLGEDPAAVGARAAASNVLTGVVAGLDDWAVCTQDTRRRDWLIQVARRADHDPTGWRPRVRDAAATADRTALAALLDDNQAPLAGQPVPFLVAAARQLNASGQNPIPFLTRVQRAHPGDFWVNVALGAALHQAADARGALRYCQAAVALRPDAATAHNLLGAVLLDTGGGAEAETHFRRALQIRPDMHVARVNLGAALASRGDLEEAVRQTEQALRQEPSDATASWRLGEYLAMAGRQSDAVGHFLKALEQRPELAATQAGMRALLTRHGRAEAVRAAWRRALMQGPSGPEVHVLDDCGAYAEYCLFIGRDDAYRVARSVLLDGLAANHDPRVGERAGRTCLLLPASADELRVATASIDTALEADRSAPVKFTPFFLFAKGLAEYRAGRTESALQILEGPAASVLGPAPGLVAAMARQRLGNAEAARQALARAVVAFDWDPGRAGSREVWMYHVLRREAERAILPELPRFLAGQYEPQDDLERVAMTAECQFRELHASRAHLLKQVIGSSPELAVKFRKLAVIPAATAGCGLGKDTPALKETERERWRAQARHWVREELAAAAAGGADQAATRARTTLASWLAAPELACVRDPPALSQLPAAERQEWTHLWEQTRKLAPPPPSGRNR